MANDVTNALVATFDLKCRLDLVTVFWKSHLFLKRKRLAVKKGGSIGFSQEEESGDLDQGASNVVLCSKTNSIFGA